MVRIVKCNNKDKSSLHILEVDLLLLALKLWDSQLGVKNTIVVYNFILSYTKVT